MPFYFLLLYFYSSLYIDLHYITIIQVKMNHCQVCSIVNFFYCSTFSPCFRILHYTHCLPAKSMTHFSLFFYFFAKFFSFYVFLLFVCFDFNVQRLNGNANRVEKCPLRSFYCFFFFSFSVGIFERKMKYLKEKNFSSRKARLL